MTIHSAPGVFDILPYDSKEEWRLTHLWQQVEEAVRSVSKAYGYQEIRTPLFERTELFQRGIGETTDIISKEMYTFLDKGNRSMSLRPEGTAPVIRAFIEHKMYQDSHVHKLFYIAPMFRYERTQAGRYRQHHQFGIEAIGSSSPEQDVEVIDLLYTLYQRLGISHLELFINSIGNKSDREAYKEALKNYLKDYFDQLSEDSQTRFHTNPLRILDSKNPQDREILAHAPSILDFIDEECQDHFQQVQQLLKNLKIPFTVSSHLVRGLDYYNKTVFEIVSGELGAQNSIGGGGRYDGLIKELGGPDLPTFGFGTGIERIIQTMLKQNVPTKSPYYPILYLIPMGQEASQACFKIVHDLRKEGISAQMDFSGKKVTKAMQLADKLNAKYTAVIGENELRSGEVELKEMSTGETSKVPVDSLKNILTIEEQFTDFASLWANVAKPFSNSQETQFFLKKLKKSIASTSQIAGELQNAAETIKNLL